LLGAGVALVSLNETEKDSPRSVHGFRLPEDLDKTGERVFPYHKTSEMIKVHPARIRTVVWRRI